MRKLVVINLLIGNSSIPIIGEREIVDRNDVLVLYGIRPSIDMSKIRFISFGGNPILLSEKSEMHLNRNHIISQQPLMDLDTEWNGMD